MIAALTEFMKALAWPFVVGSSLFYFRASIKVLLTSFERRISSGASMKLGGFELGAIEPQSKAEIKETLEQEVAQAIEASPPKPFVTARENQDSIDFVSNIEYDKGQIFIRLRDSELNILNAVKKIYGSPVNEMVKIGDLRYDGVFVKDGQLFIVEVKYAPANSNLTMLANNILLFIAESELKISTVGWRRYRYIIAVSFEISDKTLSKDELDLELRHRIMRSLGALSDKVELLTFSYSEIATRSEEF